MTKKQLPIANRRSQITWILFALVTVLLYFFALDIPLLGPDEPRYAQVAREMLERGDWITPTLGGFDWFEKPALLYWLQIISYKLFGVSEFTARFGSAIFGLGTIFALWILGKSVCSPQFDIKDKNPKPKIEAQNPKTDFANWLALIAASSLGLIVFSRGASFDIILTFPITAALVSFFIWETQSRETPSAKRKYLIFFYFFIGVALIAKGLVGIVFPFAIVAFYYVLIRQFPSRNFISGLFWGTPVILIVASVWYLPMYQANGWKFIEEFFIQHHFQRYSSNKYQHPQPFWFFWVILPLMTIPWLPFFFAGIWKFIKFQVSNFEFRINKKLETRNSTLDTFAFAWLFVPLVFFSLSGSKLPGYILPALPGALILTALYVYEFVRNSEKRAMLVKLTAILCFAVIAFLLQFGLMEFAPHESVKDLILRADQSGFASAKIVNFQTVSHNAEFYGAGRLVRAQDGTQRRFDSPQELADFLKTEKKPVLVLAPLKELEKLTAGNLLKIQLLGDNTKLAVAVAETK